MSISLFAPSIVVPIYHLKPGSQCNVTSSVYSSDEIMLGYDTCNMTTPTDNDNSKLLIIEKYYIGKYINYWENNCYYFQFNKHGIITCVFTV